jgi:polyisoprenyl-teichoic acid--peptidoglycan teichoic acid transferase
MPKFKARHFFQRYRRQLFSHVWVARCVTICLILFLLGLGWLLLGRPAKNLLSGLQTVVGTPLPNLNGRTNILLLGSGGPGHDGPDLSDTIILASVKPDPGSVTLISIPRDVWVPSLRAKINTAYHYGFEKQATSGGLLLAKSAVSEISGQPVHFAVNIDFSTFSRAIDLLGGVDVQVDHTFTDNEYPITGRENDLCGGDPDYKCRFESVTFISGPQHMDGQTALKFARSRHSLDPEEGTDFARSKRQEKIISAVKAKLSSVKNLTNTKLYRDLYNLAVNSVVTDITPQYYTTFIKLGLKIYHQPFQSFTLSAPDQLYNPPLSDKYQSQWVLIPKDNNPRLLYDYIASLLK